MCEYGCLLRSEFSFKLFVDLSALEQRLAVAMTEHSTCKRIVV